MKENFTRLFQKFSKGRPLSPQEREVERQPVEPTPLELVVAYHQRTKHSYYRYAAGPGYLDWETQPDPFRRYLGAPLLPLELCPPTEDPPYEVAFGEGQVPPAPLNRQTISQLLFDSLAISAWKQAGEAKWALRVNPSSGNLHPTEGYLLCGPVEGLTAEPMVCHYAPQEHALERRVQLPLETWQALVTGFPPKTLFIGLTSIHWREAWKYGERAFRYCQHDLGHALAAVAIAAAGLGWQARLLDHLSADQVGLLLGVAGRQGSEAEQPDCLIAIYPANGEAMEIPSLLPAELVATFAYLNWVGEPNILSSDHVPWQVIELVAEASRKPLTATGTNEIATYDTLHPSIRYATQDAGIITEMTPSFPPSSVALRRIIHQRRSALDLDGRTEISRDLFYRILAKTLPGQGPFQLWPWPSQLHLALFVHRVQGLAPGLYLLVRDPEQTEMLRAAMRQKFIWQQPEACPSDLPLYQLKLEDTRAISAQVSCQQLIAAEGCFSLGMLANFAEPLQRYGAWFYPRLFWESGLIGQVLYLEAEATGIRGTGIGCFFDDPVHTLFGLADFQYQSLYHFTLGGPVDDPRLTTLPAYPNHK
jgi:SagB-type dehydrogenase family enzyme